jgi:hypothetical protein
MRHGIIYEVPGEEESRTFPRNFVDKIETSGFPGGHSTPKRL